MKVTAKELAERLHGREYGSECDDGDERDAKESGLVVVFGYSDDNVEFRGAMNDEVGCYDGGDILVHPKSGPLSDSHECDCDFCGWKSKARECVTLKAKWCALENFSWNFELPIPHETFDVMEEGEQFCRGVIFHCDDLKAYAK